MSALIAKDKSKSLLDKDTCISDVITEAFDNIELTTIGKLCLDARVNKSLTQEQASALLKVRVKIIKDFENGDQIDLPGTAYKIGFNKFTSDTNVVKISVVGNAMRNQSGMANIMFETLAMNQINIHVISTSEIKISVLISSDYCELAMRSLHSAFGLDI